MSENKDKQTAEAKRRVQAMLNPTLPCSIESKENAASGEADLSLAPGLVVEVELPPEAKLTPEEEAELRELEARQKQPSVARDNPQSESDDKGYSPMPLGDAMQGAQEGNEPILWKPKLTSGEELIARYGLSEPNFRRFEAVIAKAVNESMFVVDPKSIESKGCGLNARSFVFNLKEAMLGYEKFGYSSFMLPPAQEFRAIRKFIRAMEQQNGMVRVINTMNVSVSLRDAPDRFTARNTALLGKLIKEYNASSYAKSQFYQGKFPIIICSSQEDVNLVVNLIRKSRNDLSVTYSERDGGLKVMPKL